MTATPVAARPSSTLDRFLALLEPAARELLQRAALLEVVPDDVARDLCADVGADPAILGILQTLPFVRPVPDRPGAFRLRDDARRELLDAWWEGRRLEDGVPEEVRRIGGQLADRLGVCEDTDEATLLGLRLLVDPATALDDWHRRYREADGTFDLLRCHELIETLRWMSAVSRQVEAVRDEYLGYLESRGLWIDAWYRTETFQRTQEAAEAFEALLTGDRGRMLELRGVGGYGKTSHLNWLIARRCVPLPHRIPSAKLDLDVVDRFTATQDPHLVLLAWADQLNRQLSRDVFGKLLAEHATEHARLYRHRSPTAAPGDVEPGAVEGDRAFAGADVRERFVAQLAERPPSRPVLLVVDTLEVAAQLPDSRGRPALERLLSLLADVQRSADCVRLVLAGRSHLDDDARGRFTAPLPPLELGRFTDEEAGSYLVEQRGIDDRDDLVRACIDKSQRVPFSLALLADLVELDPEIDAQRIERYPHADYAYLIEKVVKRIDDQRVRWVLRYAALPRRFDYEFFRDVLWPWVGKVMADPSLDDPADDPVGGPDEPLWRIGELPAEDEQQLRDLWARITQFAGPSSWVQPDERDLSALRLQSDVGRPLRALLRGRTVVEAIHADAATYFLARAASVPDLERPVDPYQLPPWTDHLRAAVFHRFQRADDGAGPWWQEQLDASESPLRRYVLADEVARSPDYRDPGDAEDGTPARDLVPPQTRQRARLELCLAAGQLALLAPAAAGTATSTGDEQWWAIAQDALTQLEREPLDGLQPSRLTLARAAMALQGSAPGRSSELLEEALAAPGVSRRERLWLALVDALRAHALGSAEAGPAMERATALADAVPEARDLRTLLATTASQHHERWGAFDRAIEVCAAAARDGLSPTKFQLTEALLDLEVGDAARALAAAAAARASEPTDAALVEARGLRRRGRLDAAAAKAGDVLALTIDPDLWWARANALLELGEVRAARLQAREARTAYAAARQLFKENGDFEAVADCHLREATLFLRGLGQLRAAGVALDHAAAAARASMPSAVRCRLLRAELAHRLEDFAAAQAALDGAAREGPRGPRATLDAALAVAGIAYDDRLSRRGEAGHRLADALARITPPVARLVLVSRLQDAHGKADDARRGVARRLRDAAVPDGGWEAALRDLEPADQAPLRLSAAALAAFLDEPAQAERHVRAALAGFLERGPDAAPDLLEVVRAARRLRLADVETQAGRAALELASRQADEAPVLAAAVRVEVAQSALDARAPGADVPGMLADAEALLRDAGNTDAWAGRLAELQARVAGSGDERKAFQRAAAKAYDAAGDLLRAHDVGSTAKSAARTVAVEVRISAGVVTAKVPRRLPRLRRDRLQADASARLRDEIARWGAGPRPEPYPAAFPELMAMDFQAFARALGEMVAAGAVRRRRLLVRQDLAIRIHDGALQPLPWELAADAETQQSLIAGFRWVYRAPAQAAPDDRLVRVVQAGLNLLGASLSVDGVEGPDTSRALRSADVPRRLKRADNAGTVQHFHESLLHGSRPRVVIARAAGARGGRRQGFALRRRYEAAGLQPVVVEESHAAALEAELAADPPPVVVHLVAGLVSGGGAAAVDLHPGTRSWSSRDEASLLTATDLDRLLDVVPPSWPVPVVVIDVPLAANPREAAGQLLLRNCFAGDLFALGGPRAVLATGLGGQQATDLTQGTLVNGLAQGRTLGDVAAQMRTQAPERGLSRFDAALAYYSTVLWTNDATARLPVARRP